MSVEEDVLRAKATDDRVASYVSRWPEELQQAFWGAVNAPTYAESAQKTLGFATALAHELAERAAEELSGCCDECNACIDLMRRTIDPEVSSGE